MTFPILLESHLPPIGSSTERRDLDFKLTYAPTDRFEMAKDVAALANTVGGSLIVGASTSGTILKSYDGIPISLGNKLAEEFERATKDLCRSSPTVSHQIISLDGRVIFVINVWASALAPIGVQLKGKDVPYSGEVWLFPFRVGTHTRFLQPDQFGTLENVTARRAAAILQAIPESERLRVSIHSVWEDRLGQQRAPQRHEARLHSIDLEANAVEFSITIENNAQSSLFVPLDWVDTAWRERIAGGGTEWAIGLAGQVKRDGARFLIVPRAY